MKKKQFSKLLTILLLIASICLSACAKDDILPVTATENAAEDTPVSSCFPEILQACSHDNAIVIPSVSQAVSDETEEGLSPIRGIYISGPIAGTDKMDEFIRIADETELNAFVIDIKNDSGEVTFHMNTPMVQEIDSDINYITDLEGLIQTCKEHHIYLIARIVAFKDPYLAQARPELALHNADGSIFYDNSGLAWVNPYETGVWDYLMEIATEAARLGFDEIQFDYLRFSTDKGMKDVDFGPSAENTDKTQIITEFTEYAYDTLSALPVAVSADVFGTIIDNSYDQSIVGQEYTELVKHLDFICPMVYPSHYGPGVYDIAVPDAQPYDTIYAALTSSRLVLGEYGNDTISSLETRDPATHACVRPWLQAFTATWVTGHIPYETEQIREQIQAVYDAGYQEWILWNAAVTYDEGFFCRMNQ